MSKLAGIGVSNIADNSELAPRPIQSIGQDVRLSVCPRLQTSLLCIVGELAGGGPGALAVGISDR